MRLARVFGALGMAAALAAQPALAQVDEADRLARCQNNREAYARAEAEYRFSRQFIDWSDEGIARARTAMVSLREDLSRFNNDLEEAREPDNRSVLYMQAAAQVGERMRQTAIAFGVLCMPGDVQCIAGLPDRLGHEIDLAVAGQQPQQLAARQMQQYQTNLLALHCDQPGTGYPLADPYGTRWSESEGGWSGDWVRRGNSNIFDATWNGSVRAVLTISISGNSVSVSRVGSTDGNNCQYQGTLDGNRVAGTYRCTSGGGEWSATIQ